MSEPRLTLAAEVHVHHRFWTISGVCILVTGVAFVLGCLSSSTRTTGQDFIREEIEYYSKRIRRQEEAMVRDQSESRKLVEKVRRRHVTALQVISRLASEGSAAGSRRSGRNASTLIRPYLSEVVALLSMNLRLRVELDTFPWRTSRVEATLGAYAGCILASAYIADSAKVRVCQLQEDLGEWRVKSEGLVCSVVCFNLDNNASL